MHTHSQILMHTDMCAHSRTFTHMDIHIMNTCAFMDTPTHSRTLTHVDTYTYPRTFVHSYRKHLCVLTDTHTHSGTLMHTGTHTATRAHIHIHPCAWTLKDTHTRGCLRTLADIHTHTRTCTHTITCLQTRSQSGVTAGRRGQHRLWVWALVPPSPSVPVPASRASSPGLSS